MLGDEGRARATIATILAVLLLAVAGAGCIGEEEQGPSEGDDTRPTGSDDRARTQLAWGLDGCEVVVAVIPVEAEALSEHLPEGFEPISGEEAFGLPPDLRGEAAIGLETFSCDSGTGLDGSIQDLAYGAIFSPVEPPGDAPGPDGEVHFFKWETLVPDSDRRQRLSAAGLPVVDGSTDLGGLEVTPAGHIFDVSLTLGEGTYSFSGSAAQPAEDFRQGFAFVEYQTADGGLATWSTMENAAPGANSGTGIVQLPAGSWTADVVGAERSQAFMVASTGVTFEEAMITLP